MCFQAQNNTVNYYWKVNLLFFKRVLKLLFECFQAEVDIAWKLVSTNLVWGASGKQAAAAGGRRHGWCHVRQSLMGSHKTLRVLNLKTFDMALPVNFYTKSLAVKGCYKWRLRCYNVTLHPALIMTDSLIDWVQCGDRKLMKPPTPSPCHIRELLSGLPR